ncbi:hypothetical protein EJ04DRAFT_575354 [Polyplosphaeria fusca]|uniref:Uncharacterized protein n=1 Tax=Polyplosphaeria fusca TaxID=682080 RepID=A0A9P4R1U3_9PLEO|nr:hypothetical protein EJ04DRAFT_575354 [Polyplosphaeria fusca]
MPIYEKEISLLQLADYDLVIRCKNPKTRLEAVIANNLRAAVAGFAVNTFAVAGGAPSARELQRSSDQPAPYSKACAHSTSSALAYFPLARPIVFSGPGLLFTTTPIDLTPSSNALDIRVNILRIATLHDKILQEDRITSALFRLLSDLTPPAHPITKASTSTWPTTSAMVLHNEPALKDLAAHIARLLG